MPDTDAPGRTERHEAGHVVAADVFGCRQLGVTARPGSRWAGCARHYPPPPESALAELRVEIPFVLWPEAMRRRIEAAVIIGLAGELAELILAEPSIGRITETVAEQASARVEELAATLPQAAPADLAALRTWVDTPSGSDADQVARWAWLAHGSADLATARAWLDWADAAARSLLLAHAGRVQRVAGLLAVTGSLSGEQAAAALRD